MTISTQTSRPVFAERIEQVKKKTKIEVERIKSVYCFLDSYGSFSSDCVTFEIKIL